ncbi:hypothetical protein EBU99_05100 [bacterium]|nr:hypothetical protein [bacterium]
MKPRSENFMAQVNSLRAAACIASFAFVVSCSDNKQETAPDLTKFSGIYSSYLKSCGECHEPNNIDAYKDNVPNLDLSTEDAAYTSLLKSVEIRKKTGAGCPAAKYVEPGRVSSSYLFAVLDSETADSFATGGNSSCKPLYHTKKDGGVANEPSAEQKTAISNWIKNGALRN